MTLALKNTGTLSAHESCSPQSYVLNQVWVSWSLPCSMLVLQTVLIPPSFLKPSIQDQIQTTYSLFWSLSQTYADIFSLFSPKALPTGLLPFIPSLWFPKWLLYFQVQIYVTGMKKLLCLLGLFGLQNPFQTKSLKKFFLVELATPFLQLPKTFVWHV